VVNFNIDFTKYLPETRLISAVVWSFNCYLAIISLISSFSLYSLSLILLRILLLMQLIKLYNLQMTDPAQSRTKSHLLITKTESLYLFLREQNFYIE
jgi:hypothetical protein